MFCKSVQNVTGLQNILRRSIQTVRNAADQNAASATVAVPVPGIVDQFGFKNYPFGEVSKESRVANILQQVKATDGLPLSPSHIEHLVGRATKGRIYQKQGLFPEENGASTLCGGISSIQLDLNRNQEKYEGGGIDIAEKTQLILQSPHPVRYVIEREISNSQLGFHSRLPSYHTWIMLFGRSLLSKHRRSNDYDYAHYDKLLNDIANASDSGMFSSDIHHTIIDIPEDHPSFSSKCSVQFHMGNKYSVLVGDYFAIRCIYYAERTKTNSVMVAVTEGVEEFTTCTFGTNLFDDNVGYPFLLSPGATINDWARYNERAFGYFKGGLNAALSLHPNMKNQYWRSLMDKFTGNMSTFLKAALELESLQRADDFVVPSPFLLTSLPAILYQSQKPETFTAFRKFGYDLDAEHVKQVHDIIRDNAVSMEQSRKLMATLAHETKKTFRIIASDEYYINVFESLIDAVAESV